MFSTPEFLKLDIISLNLTLVSLESYYISIRIYFSGHIDLALRQEAATPILLFGPKVDQLVSMVPRGGNLKFF